MDTVAIFWLIVLFVMIVLGLLIIRERRRMEVARREVAEILADLAYDPLTHKYDPRKLKMGDAVEWYASRGLKYTVRDVVTFLKQESPWREYILTTTQGDRVYLVVTTHGRVEVVIWTVVPWVHGIVPGASPLNWHDTTYGLQDSGTTVYEASGAIDLPSSGVVAYHDYSSLEGGWLSFRQFNDGAWEVVQGVPVPSGSLTIYPAAS